MTRTKLTSARPGLKDVSGEKVIKAPLTAIAKVLTDCSTKTQWVSGLIEEREIERGEEEAFAGIPAEFVIYQHYTLIPMFSERDYVISGLWQVTKSADGESAEAAILDLQSIEHDKAPKNSNKVRAALNRLVYTLQTLPGDEGTRVRVECNVDPLGVLPIFLVNLYASSWSEKTLTALESQVLKQ